jgi:hypothetical protein
MQLDILDIGTEVEIDGDIRARIRAVEIRGPQRLITYQCSWWDERTQKVEWFYSDEVTPISAEKKKIGLT